MTVERECLEAFQSLELGDASAEDLPVTAACGIKRTTDDQPATPGGMLRFNSGKLRMSLVPASFTRYTVSVLAYGAIKYQANNWRKGGSWTENYESLQRHLDAWREGEDCDVESALPHLAHAAFGIMVLIEFFDKNLGVDDRFRYPGQPDGEQAPGRVLKFNQPPQRTAA